MQWLKEDYLYYLDLYYGHMSIMVDCISTGYVNRYNVLVPLAVP